MKQDKRCTGCSFGIVKGGLSGTKWISFMLKFPNNILFNSGSPPFLFSYRAKNETGFLERYMVTITFITIFYGVSKGYAFPKEYFKFVL